MSAGITGKLNVARQILLGKIESAKLDAADRALDLEAATKQLRAIDRLITEALDCIPAPVDPVMDDHDAGWNSCLDRMNDGTVIKSPDKVTLAALMAWRDLPAHTQDEYLEAVEMMGGAK